MNQFARHKQRHRCREQTYGHQGGEEWWRGGGGGMNWEIGIDMYTLIRIKWTTNKNLLCKKINKIQKFKKIYIYRQLIQLNKKKTNNQKKKKI